MRTFKGVENDMIWEGYHNVPNDQAYADEYNDDNTFYEDDAEDVILQMEPEAPLEVEVEPESMEDDLFEDEDDGLDNEIIVKALRKLIKRADILMNHCEGDKLDTWMVAKIIKAEDYISDVWNELDDVADFANDGFEDAENFSM